MIQYPFLAASVFSGWILPQFIGLIINHEELPKGALDKTLLMTIFCIVGCFAGHCIKAKPASLLSKCYFDSRRLLIASAILSLLGAYFFYRVGLLADTAGGIWTGVITIFYFLSGMLFVGVAIATVVYVHSPSYAALLIIVFDLSFFLNRVLLQGRRRALIEICSLLALALWFRFRRVPSRALIVSIFLIGTLWINSIGDYRNSVQSGQLSWSELSEINFIGNFKDLAQNGGHEVRNAVFNIAAYDRYGGFDLGIVYWNQFVRFYVPGQIIGRDIKESLFVDKKDVVSSNYSHTRKTGTTSTGMSDSFQSFWYFGALNFVFISYVLRKIFRAANNNSVAAQILLILILPTTLEAITHGTERFFLAWPRIIAFLLPALLFAKIKIQKNKNRLYGLNHTE